MLARMPEAYTDVRGEMTEARMGISLLGQAPPSDGSAASSPEGGASSNLTPALYSYNDRNQMVEATTGGSTVSNTFNAEGLRVSKTVDDVTTYYCYEYSQVIKEVDSEGSKAYNVYGTNLISRELDGEKVYYIYNGHGDVTGLLSSNGTVIVSYYYSAFGEILEESGSFGNPYRYSGYQYDEQSQLYHLNARFYDAKLARFMQEDTFLGNGVDPLSLNLYSYVSNNPLIYWDPTGHWAVGDETLPLKAQAQIIQYTNDYYNATTQAGKKAAQDAADKVRADNAGSKSVANITTSGQTFTNVIHKSSTGYLTSSDWSAALGINTTTTISNNAVLQGASVTTNALNAANALNKTYADVSQHGNTDLLLKGQGPSVRQYNDLALYYALKDLSGGKLTDQIINNKGSLRNLTRNEQETLGLWYVDTSGKTLQDKGYTVNSKADDAVQIKVSGDKITLDIQVGIYGSGAGKSPAGTTDTYRELAIAGMENDWGGKYWIEGRWVEVTVNVNDVSGTSTSTSTTRNRISIEIIDGLGLSNIDGVTQNKAGDIWSTSNRGKMVLYLGVNSADSPSEFKNKVGHEFGHNLGMGDLYESRDGSLSAVPRSTASKNDRMRSIDTGSKTSVFNIRTLITANQSNVYQEIR